MKLVLLQVLELYVIHHGEFGTAEQIVKDVVRTISAEVQWSDVNLPAMEAWLDSHLPVASGSGSPVLPLL
jgi:hypothetical protein